MALSKLRATSKIAAQISGVDIQHFNEIVSDGFYPCAPQTTRGKARIFDVNDILALCAYRDLTETGISPSKAGEIACELRSGLNIHEEAKGLVYVKLNMGSPRMYLQENFDFNDMSHDHAEIVFLLVFPLEKRRNDIVQYLEDARLIVGLADE